jgi:hypothetical protein
MKKAKNKTWTEWPTTKSLEWPFEEVELSFPMKRPREGKAKIDSMTDEELINSMPILENEEMWASRVIDEAAREQLNKISENENVNEKK